MEVFNSVQVSLADLCAKGTAHFAQKNYEQAEDYYARAAELQSELRGEMHPDNAEILFLYGRALFKVGQSKSDVLGGKSGGEKKKPNGVAKPKKAEPKEELKTESEKIAEEGVAIVAGQGEAEVDSAKKPLFQFTGDENFEDSDEEEEAAEGEEAEEDEDELAAAFEMLELARVLYTAKLAQPEDGEGKGKNVGDSPTTRHIKERLADTHDLLAEISLENERFPGAVNDFRSSLSYKNELYPEESEIIAEAHFKLSLALEFASITRANDDKQEGEDGEGDTHIDQGLRDEAVKELEAAIKSSKLKLENKEIELATMHNPDENEVTRVQIADVKEMVAEMENRLAELKAPPVDVKDVLYGSDGIPSGILGATLGESPAEAAARIEEAKKNATDLTGLVKRKPKAVEQHSADTNGTSTNGKRKAEDDGEEGVKKVKFDEVAQAPVPRHAQVEDAVDTE